MSLPAIAMPTDVRAEYRPWVMACLTAIAEKIGWDATLKAVEAGLTYHRANPLPKRVKPTPAPDPKPDPVTPDAPAASGLTFSRGNASRYVKWSPAVDRTGWGEGPQAGCDGLLYGCKVGGTPRKVEHIKIGRQFTGLKNAYADAPPKYNQGWVKGDRVLLQVRTARGKLLSPAHQGEWTIE